MSACRRVGRGAGRRESGCFWQRGGLVASPSGGAAVFLLPPLRRRLPAPPPSSCSSLLHSSDCEQVPRSSSSTPSTSSPLRLSSGRPSGGGREASGGGCCSSASRAERSTRPSAERLPVLDQHRAVLHDTLSGLAPSCAPSCGISHRFMSSQSPATRSALSCAPSCSPRSPAPRRSRLRLGRRGAGREAGRRWLRWCGSSLARCGNQQPAGVHQLLITFRCGSGLARCGLQLVV